MKSVTHQAQRREAPVAKLLLLQQGEKIAPARPLVAKLLLSQEGEKNAPARALVAKLLLSQQGAKSAPARPLGRAAGPDGRQECTPVDWCRSVEEIPGLLRAVFLGGEMRRGAQRRR